MKKDELIEENKKIKKEIALLNKRIEEYDKNDIEIEKQLNKNIKKTCIIDEIFSILLLVAILVVLIHSISYSINQIKTRQMINNADACVEINDDIYCKIEVKND